MEFLKDFLTEETYAKVEEELQGKDVKLANLRNGEYVSKDKYSALEQSNTDLKNQLLTKSAAYDDLIAKAGDNEDLKNQIEQLKTSTAEQINNATQQYESKLKSAAITTELVKSKVKDVADIIGQLNMEAITYKDDVLTGLNEQIDKLKEKKPYLFEKEGKKGKGGLDHDGDDDTADAEEIRKVLGLI